MAKISYASLKLKVKDDVKTFNFNGQDIEVKQYLPINDKYDLVMITLQKAAEGNLYNELKMDMYLQLHIVYMYTNLSITDKQKEDEGKLYDALETNGFFEQMYEEAFNEEEYNTLIGYIEKQKADELQYNTTAAAIIKTIVQDLPQQAEAVAQIVDNFQPEKFQAVVDFAKAANGGRDIPAGTK